MLREQRPAVIVAANPYPLMFSALAKHWSGVPAKLAVTWHSTYLLNAKERVQMLYYRAFFWAADCAVFVCEKQRRFWMRRGLLSRRNRVIYNGVDTGLFDQDVLPTPPEEVRAALGFAPSDY